MEEDPILFNEKKRKLLGDEIHDGFLHPKKFKTNSFVLQNSELDETQRVTPKEKTAQKRKLDEVDETKSFSNQKKHKFQII